MALQKRCGLYARHHHAAEKHQLRNGPRHRIERSAQDAAVEFRRLEWPLAKRGAGKILTVVGMVRIGPKHESGVPLQVRHHRRPGFQKSLAQAPLGLVAD